MTEHEFDIRHAGGLVNQVDALEGAELPVQRGGLVGDSFEHLIVERTPDNRGDLEGSFRLILKPVDARYQQRLQAVRDGNVLDGGGGAPILIAID